jgi:hypothetical protein
VSTVHAELEERARMIADIEPVKLPPITCARCGGKDIDYVHEYRDPCRDVHVYILECHGQTERIELEYELFISGARMQMVPYVAFKSAASLPAPTRELGIG